jgi:dTMP kinase
MFITLEGIDGCGKSTQLKYIARFLEENMTSEFLVTREPGGWPGGKALKEVLLGTPELSEESEILLFFADRQEHLRRVVLPALQRGVLVVCERYMDSTEAYQSGKSSSASELMRRLADFFSFPSPDCTIYYALSPEVGLQRISARNSLDVIESRGESFLASVTERYEILYEQNRSRMVKIDAELPPEAVWEATKKLLKERLSF